jgi:tellurite resistance protein
MTTFFELLPLLVVVVVVALIWRARQSRTESGTAAAQPTYVAPSASASFDDAYEGSFIENAADPVPVDAYVEITYRDAKGNQSRRRIRTREFDRANTNGYLTAHCEMRGAFRTFRMDRVTRAVDADTGEVLPSLHAFLSAKYDASPERAMERTLSDADLELNVLMYIARADGSFRKAEKELILEFLRARMSDERVDDQALAKQLAVYGTGSVHVFKREVGKLAALPAAQREALHTLATRLIETQKTVHPAEQEALAYLAKRLGVRAETTAA